jgi:hypothetical protein
VNKKFLSEISGSKSKIKFETSFVDVAREQLFDQSAFEYQPSLFSVSSLEVTVLE